MIEHGKRPAERQFTQHITQFLLEPGRGLPPVEEIESDLLHLQQTVFVSSNGQDARTAIKGNKDKD